MYLVEDFYSIQGEGRYAGVPSIFFRFGGCNLKCRGFNVSFKSLIDDKMVVGCDSVRAVNKNFKPLWQKVNSSEILLNIIEKHSKNISFKPHIVITGGEPLIFYKNRYFYDLISYLIDNFFLITIETNATILINFEKYPKYKNVTFALGVKLSNSKESKERRLNFKAISAILKNSSKSFFKFVLDKHFIENGIAKKEIFEITNRYENKKIYCMPLGENGNELSLNDKIVANFCKQYGFIYNDRLHIRLWGNKLGV